MHAKEGKYESIESGESTIVLLVAVATVFRAMLLFIAVAVKRFPAPQDPKSETVRYVRDRRRCSSDQ